PLWCDLWPEMGPPPLAERSPTSSTEPGAAFATSPALLPSMSTSAGCPYTRSLLAARIRSSGVRRRRLPRNCQPSFGYPPESDCNANRPARNLAGSSGNSRAAPAATAVRDASSSVATARRARKRISERLPGIEQERHRAVVLERHLHVCAETSRLDRR